MLLKITSCMGALAEEVWFLSCFWGFPVAAGGPLWETGLLYFRVL